MSRLAMFSEAELIEMEGRAEMLVSLTDDVLAAVAESLTERGDLSPVDAIDDGLTRHVADFERLVEFARTAGLA